MNIINCEYLKNQISEKKALKAQKMNDNEYALNQRLLHTIRSCQENEIDNEVEVIPPMRTAEVEKDN